ncbi:MAG: flagellar biosynthesis anti-sigma factor FlgM [Firmicutes bacterium]|nr:flagellar biosynthesis anti-sigma factor FlgM [Bacillota bacterium]
MYISTNQIHNALKVYNQQSKVKRSAKTEKAAPSMGKDKMVISNESKTVQAVKQRLASVPEIREDKVNQLREAVKTGTYNVSGREVAEKVLGRSIVDRLG